MPKPLAQVSARGDVLHPVIDRLAPDPAGPYSIHQHAITIAVTRRLVNTFDLGHQQRQLYVTPKLAIAKSESNTLTRRHRTRSDKGQTFSRQPDETAQGTS